MRGGFTRSKLQQNPITHTAVSTMCAYELEVIPMSATHIQEQ